jgi:hypothetical protein
VGTARGLIGKEVMDVEARVSQAMGGIGITLTNADNLDILRLNMLLG